MDAQVHVLYHVMGHAIHRVWEDVIPCAMTRVSQLVRTHVQTDVVVVAKMVVKIVVRMGAKEVVRMDVQEVVRMDVQEQ